MRKLLGLTAALALAGFSCTTLPTPRYTNYELPKRGVYIDDAAPPHRVIGVVRTKVNYPSLDEARDEETLCRNYYNKAVADLLERARKQGADAIAEVRSVVFMEDGTHEIYKTPECADDGQEGQILTQAKAIKWLRTKAPAGEAAFTPVTDEGSQPPKKRRVIRRDPLPEMQDPESPAPSAGIPAGSPLSSPLGR